MTFYVPSCPLWKPIDTIYCLVESSLGLNWNLRFIIQHTQQRRIHFHDSIKGIVIYNYKCRIFTTDSLVAFFIYYTTNETTKKVVEIPKLFTYTCTIKLVLQMHGWEHFIHHDIMSIQRWLHEIVLVSCIWKRLAW